MYYISYRYIERIRILDGSTDFGKLKDFQKWAKTGVQLKNRLWGLQKQAPPLGSVLPNWSWYNGTFLRSSLYLTSLYYWALNMYIPSNSPQQRCTHTSKFFTWVSSHFFARHVSFDTLCAPLLFLQVAQVNLGRTKIVCTFRPQH
jgi:hypothetical protein